RLVLPPLLGPRLPHRAPLFPYTTLFRSPVSVTTEDGVEARATYDAKGRLTSVSAADGSRTFEYDARGRLARMVDGPVETTFTHGDRKSTRLNSSHGSISYAVFCLTNNSS